MASSQHAPARKGKHTLVRTAQRASTKRNKLTHTTACAWVTRVWLKQGGKKSIPDAATLVAHLVSVNEMYPTRVADRLRLMRAIGNKLGGMLPRTMDSLWVYPGGFFGFDARKFYEVGGVKAWQGVEPFSKIHIPNVISAHPSRTTIAFGADNRQLEQRLFVCGNSVELLEVIRGNTDLAHRKSNVGGGLTAAFFVCGEFTGSWTSANRPFFQDQVLTEPVSELQDCDLLIDLAHSRVRRTINQPPMQRQVHQLQMLRFTKRGTALLTHHHGGDITQGRPRADCSPYWIAYQGSDRLDDAAEIISIAPDELP